VPKKVGSINLTEANYKRKISNKVCNKTFGSIQLRIKHFYELAVRTTDLFRKKTKIYAIEKSSFILVPFHKRRIERILKIYYAKKSGKEFLTSNEGNKIIQHRRPERI